jgi:hypothetical protein
MGAVLLSDPPEPPVVVALALPCAVALPWPVTMAWALVLALALDVPPAGQVVASK